MRMLVVDDEDHIRRMMRLTLEASGYEVEEASDGDHGLRLFGDGQRFDATLLDQRMPGLDGLETLRRMRAERADACIIMVTAYGTIDLAVDAMKLGATDFIRKPMTPETLRQAVAAALAKRDRRGASEAPKRPDTTPATGVLPPVETWTTNGYFIRHVDRPSAIERHQSLDHYFLVRRGKAGDAVNVVVSIDPKAVERVARESHGRLQPAGAFWRGEAETALVNYLWSEAEIPRGRRLVITRVTGTMLDAAAQWPGD